MPLRLTRRSKFNAVKTVVDGITFHSEKEALRYQELRLLEKAGEIRALALQPLWPLYVSSNVYAEEPKEIGAYVADFAYEDKRTGWSVVIEDVKGFRTALYKWKKRHVEAQYGITIQEV